MSYYATNNVEVFPSAFRTTRPNGKFTSENNFINILNSLTDIEYIGSESDGFVVSFNETSTREICEECAYYSLLDEKKCVIVFGFKVDKDINIMEEYLKNPNPNTTLVLVMDNFDKRTTFYKLVKEYEGTE